VGSVSSTELWLGSPSGGTGWYGRPSARWVLQYLGERGHRMHTTTNGPPAGAHAPPRPRRPTPRQCNGNIGKSSQVHRSEEAMNRPAPPSRSELEEPAVLRQVRVGACGEVKTAGPSLLALHLRNAHVDPSPARVRLLRGVNPTHPFPTRHRGDLVPQARMCGTPQCG